jgi:hypothetical protein
VRILQHLLYLFIRVDTTPPSNNQTANATPQSIHPTVYIEQDPTHSLRCGLRSVSIPQSAFTTSRRMLGPTRGKRRGRRRSKRRDKRRGQRWGKRRGKRVEAPRFRRPSTYTAFEAYISTLLFLLTSYLLAFIKLDMDCLFHLLFPIKQVRHSILTNDTPNISQAVRNLARHHKQGSPKMIQLCRIHNFRKLPTSENGDSTHKSAPVEALPARCLNRTETGTALDPNQGQDKIYQQLAPVPALSQIFSIACSSPRFGLLQQQLAILPSVKFPARQQSPAC